MSNIRATIFSGSINQAVASDQLVQVSEFSADTAEIIKSNPSIHVFHSTLFENFNLKCVPQYNFYSSDEQTNQQQDKLEDLRKLPRYITLSWNKVPNKTVQQKSTKGIKPVDTRKFEISKVSVQNTTDAKKSLSNGYLSPGVVSALIVKPTSIVSKPKFNEEYLLQSKGKISALSNLDNKKFHLPVMPVSNSRTRANFVDPSINNVLSDNRIKSSNEVHHISSMVNLSKLLPSLEVLSELNQDADHIHSVQTFPAPQHFSTITYIGYVIERYEIASDGLMSLSKTIDIDDISVGSIVDRDVLFGKNYVYRIKTIVQWAHSSDSGFFGKTKFDILPIFNTSKTSNKVASFYSGDWSDFVKCTITDDKLPDEIDEIYIRPISSKKMINICWKMPADYQKDLKSIVLLKATSNNGKISDWKKVAEFDIGNGMYNDEDVSFYESANISYIYALYSTSVHDEISKLSDQFEVRLTNRYKYMGEYDIKRVVPKGAAVYTHASYRQGHIKNVVANNSITFYCRTGKNMPPFFNNDYVAEIQSLSTGETIDVKISLQSFDSKIKNTVSKSLTRQIK